MRYGDLTYLEIAELVQAGWTAIVPAGCTEQQGPHLPIDLDTYWVTQVAEAISNAASEREGIESLVVPALPFGPTPEHRGYGSGYIDLPQSLHEEVVYAILDSLAQQGFRRVVVVTGCGQHRVEAPIARLNAAYAPCCWAGRLELPMHDIWCQVGDARVPGGHADSFATSIALYLRPASVRAELIRNPQHGPVDWDDPQPELIRLSPSGVVGDPTHASAALGKRLWEAVIDAGVAALKELVTDGEGSMNRRDQRPLRRGLVSDAVSAVAGSLLSFTAEPPPQAPAHGCTSGEPLP
jgi:creatinine amidohydrolase